MDDPPIPGLGLPQAIYDEYVLFYRRWLENWRDRAPLFVLADWFDDQGYFIHAETFGYLALGMYRWDLNPNQWPSLFNWLAQEVTVRFRWECERLTPLPFQVGDRLRRSAWTGYPTGATENYGWVEQTGVITKVNHRSLWVQPQQLPLSPEQGPKPFAFNAHRRVVVRIKRNRYLNQQQQRLALPFLERSYFEVAHDWQLPPAKS